jgi:tetrahydromethanopterin S-methyltransferase subunit E
VIVFGISFAVGAILGTIASSSSLAVVLTLSSLSRAIAAILGYPLVAAISVVIYASLRSQKEGVSPEALVPAID